MENIWLTGLYLLSSLGVIFSMRLYIRCVGTIDKLIVWLSLFFSFVPVLNFIVTAIYLFLVAFEWIKEKFDWIMEKLDDMQDKRKAENRRSFLEHLLHAEKDCWGDYEYKRKEQKKN